MSIEKAFSAGVRNLMGEGFEKDFKNLEKRVVERAGKKAEKKQGIYWVELMGRYLELSVRKKIKQTEVKFFKKKHSINLKKMLNFLTPESQQKLCIKRLAISNREILTKVRVFCTNYESPNKSKNQVETLWDLAQKLFEKKGIKLNLGTLHSLLAGNLKTQYSRVDISYKNMERVSQFLEHYQSPNKTKDEFETLWDLAQKLYKWDLAQKSSKEEDGIKINLGVLHAALEKELKLKYSCIKLSYKDMEKVSKWLIKYKSPNKNKDEKETLWDLAQKLFKKTGIKMNLRILYSAFPAELKSKYSCIWLTYNDMEITSQWLDAYQSPNETIDEKETLWDLAQKLYAAEGIKINLGFIYSALPAKLKSQYSYIALSYENMETVIEWINNYQSPNQTKDEFETLWDLAQKLYAEKGIQINLSILHSALPERLKSKYSGIKISYKNMEKVIEWLNNYESPNETKDEFETLWDLAQKLYAEKGIQMNLESLHSALPARLRSKYSCIWLSYNDMEKVSQWLKTLNLQTQNLSSFDLTKKFLESEGGFFIAPKTIWRALPRNMKEWVEYSKMTPKKARILLRIN